jgi:hypothetical protein
MPRRTSAEFQPRLLRRAIDPVLWTVFLALHTKRQEHGITVIVSDTSMTEAEALDRVRRVLRFLHGTDPLRFRWVQRYVRHVVVWPGDYTAYDRRGGIHLSGRYLHAAPEAIVAGGLVHEAVHLRIQRCRIEYRPRLRERIETICTREQAAFLRKVPGSGSSWAADAEADLAQPWWTEEDRQARVERAGKQAGLSAWARKLLRRFSSDG